MAQTVLRKTGKPAKKRRRMKQLQLPKHSANRRVEHTSPTHDQHDGASVTYQLELVQCGKPRCRRWHGPYWYAYWSSKGKTRSMYIGKLLRPASVVHAARLLHRETTQGMESTS